MGVLNVVLPVVVIACLAQCLKANSACSLPEPMSIDWNRLQGEWYQIATARDELDMLHDCVSATNMQMISPDQIHIQFDAYSKHSLVKIMPVNLTMLPSGYYLWNKDRDEKFTAGLEEAEKGDPKIKKEVDQEIIDLYEAKHAYYTDYKSYWIELICGEKDFRYVWIHSLNRHPGPGVIVDARNMLVSFGHGWSSTILTPSPCVS